MRLVVRGLLTALAITGAVTLPAASQQDSSTQPAAKVHELSMVQLVGEHHSYDIAFLWFSRLARGDLSLTAGERPGTYVATLDAQTRGLAAWATRDRSERHQTLMEEGPNGRLRTLVSESQSSKGRDQERAVRSRRYEFDYEARDIRQLRVKRGDSEETLTEMPAEHSDLNDPLTAFYNLRTGRFGPLEPGRRYEIPTFGRKGVGMIVIEILSPENRPHQGFFPAGGVLCRVELDEEMFETSDGEVYVWFDLLGRPNRGIVENVIGMGNVRGTLRQ